MSPKTKYQEFKVQQHTTQQHQLPLPIQISLLPVPASSQHLWNSTNKQTNMPTISNFYTMQEASLHNTKDDCWIVVDGKVPTFPPIISFSFKFPIWVLMSNVLLFALFCFSLIIACPLVEDLFLASNFHLLVWWCCWICSFPFIQGCAV